MATQARRLAVDILQRASRRPAITAPCVSVFHYCKIRPQSTQKIVPPRAPRKDNPERPTESTKQGVKGKDKSIRIAQATGLGLLIGSGLALLTPSTDPSSEPSNNPSDSSSERPPLDGEQIFYRIADIRAHHGPTSKHPWVIFEDKVYDITDWVVAHPGGDVILRAAGGSIEPYWDIFSIHKAQHVREILAQYQIGRIDPADLVDGRPACDKAIEDPFVHDPERDPRLITHTVKPRNAEPPNAELDRSFKTPNELFYVRHHMWVPEVDADKADEHVLVVELPDGETRKYTLAELKRRFQTHRVTAALQCSGNRRNDMTRHAGKTNGLQWGVGAISNAEWEGVRLGDVLADAGLKVADATALTQEVRKQEAPPVTPPPASNDDDTPQPPDANSLHVQFSGLEAYGASIPLSKALDPRGDVLLAFAMNGASLPRDHGFPLRAVVPGHVAARSVKWLSKIVVADEESQTQWQRRDYKAFGPNEGAKPDWDRAVSIQEMPVTSAITGVWVGECVRKGRVPWMKTMADMSRREIASSGASAEPVAIQGYAYSGGGRGIARVDVSLDGGKTWDQAELMSDCGSSGNTNVSSGVDGDKDDTDTACFGNKRWAWTRWRYTGKLPVAVAGEIEKGGLTESSSGKKDKSQKKFCTTLVVKATDDAYNTQPESHRGIYNVRGNLATAWHRVRICPTCVTAAAAALKHSGNPNGDGDEKGNKGAEEVRWSTGKVYGCGFRQEEEGQEEGAGSVLLGGKRIESSKENT